MAVVVVAEWLRRWTRNPLGSPRAGSNPADYEELLSCFLALISKFLEMIFDNKQLRSQSVNTFEPQESLNA